MSELHLYHITTKHDPYTNFFEYTVGMSNIVLLSLWHLYYPYHVATGSGVVPVCVIWLFPVHMPQEIRILTELDQC